MRHSDMTDAQKAETKAWIDLRHEQLVARVVEGVDKALDYLLIVNGAAIAGVLSFLGSMAHLRSEAWPKQALLCFVFGIVALGIYHVVRTNYGGWITGGFNADVSKFWRNEIVWNELTARDESRAKKAAPLLYIPSYFSFLSFLVGLVIICVNFGDITSAPAKPHPVTEKSK